MASRQLIRILLIVAILALSTSVLADTRTPNAVPEASVFVLAPMGIAAVVAAERRRRLASIRNGVGVLYFAVKRTVDVALASAVLLATLPIAAVIALLVGIDSPGPIVFKRRVIGKDGKFFDMYKFRSMIQGAEDALQQDEVLKNIYYNGNCKIETDPRVTRIGTFLRKTSLDELPQLVNVILGNMTFVGPRPIAEDEIDIYGPCIERFKTVTPGITGLWQTGGRSETSYEKRVKMDMDYIEQRSIMMDLAILMSTVPAVVRKRGAM